MIRAVYAVALFLSATLLFLIQPMIAKMILPLLGGTPAVWNTCLVFFQVTLLAGYLYAHGLSRSLRPRGQSLWHLGMLLLPFLTLSMLLFPLRLTHGTSSSFALPSWVPQGPGIHSWLLQAPDPARPISGLLLLLLVCVGLPFFVVSATAPLLQHWFASTTDSKSNDPYFLYAASNSGSLIALLAYPAIVEPRLSLEHQAWAWQIGYGLLVGFIALCGLLLWKLSSPKQRSEVRDQKSAARNPTSASTLTSDLCPLTSEQEPRPPLTRRLRWLALAAIPSSLLLGVTTFLSTNVAAVPLLWIIPLTLYLLTFVLVFSRAPFISLEFIGRALPFVILLQTFVFAIDLKHGAWVLFVLHLGCFFVAALYCHGRLAQDRPAPRYLTEFYLWLAAGGMLGGLFNVLVAPVIFNSLVEYPLALVLVCLFLPRSFVKIPSFSANLPRPVSRGRIVTRSTTGGPEPSLDSHLPTADQKPAPILSWGDLCFPAALGLLIAVLVLGLRILGLDALWLKAMLLIGLPAAICSTFVGHPVRFALGIGVLFLIGGIGRDFRVVHQERSFFGVMTVMDKTMPGDPPTAFRYFRHGDTNHGQQNLDPERRQEPLAYYLRTGPVGQLFDSQSKPPSRVAVLGLGAGALACYAEPGQEWTFYEIDPAVESIARSYFTFLRDAQDRGVHTEVIIGDGRLSVAHAPDHSYDLIFADAFTSDAVPVHLLTRQALELYLSKLTEDGLLAFNITNRYVDLEPVLGALANHAGLVCISRKEETRTLTEQEELQGKVAAHWVIMARHEKDLGRLPGKPGWKQVPPGSAEWTDDYSNLLGAFRW